MITHFGQTVIRVINHTDQTAHLFVTRDCTGASTPVAPGVDTEDFDPASSVIFGP